jgi:hypothetical protein
VLAVQHTINTVVLQIEGYKMKSFYNRQRAVLGLAALAFSGAPLYAQTTTNPPAATPPTADPQAARPGNARREERREQRRQELQNMTPEQRQQLMRQNRETSMRRLLERAGVTDVTTQNTIVTYATNEQEARDRARQTLRASNQKLAQAVRTGAVTESQLGTLLDEFQNAAADEKDRRAKSAADLDRKVGYTKNPRLEAVLTTLGIVGDESLYMTGGVGAGFGGGRGAAPRAGAARNAAPGALRPRLRGDRAAGVRQPGAAAAGTPQQAAPQPVAP